MQLSKLPTKRLTSSYIYSKKIVALCNSYIIDKHCKYEHQNKYQEKIGNKSTHLTLHF